MVEDAWPPYVAGPLQHAYIKDRVLGATLTLVDDAAQEELSVGQGVLPGEGTGLAGSGGGVLTGEWAGCWLRRGRC